jgi:hypothetical protein
VHLILAATALAAVVSGTTIPNTDATRTRWEPKSYVYRPLVESRLPKLVQHDFVDPSHFTTISAFRSADGHDFSDNGETCRSMKHYFVPNQDAAWLSRPAPTADSPLPSPPPEQAVAVFSPVDGVVSRIEPEPVPYGESVSIVPRRYPAFTIRLSHVFPGAGVRAGMRVRAGAQIASIWDEQEMDVAVEAYHGTAFARYVSYFDVMPDRLFAAYRARGVTSRNELVLTSAYRDAHPVQCVGQTPGDSAEFALEYAAQPGYDEDVHLAGYVPPPPQFQPTDLPPYPYARQP